MATFFVIDHSLRSTGDHHLDMVDCMVRAAKSMGFDVIVGANRSFRKSTELEQQATVLRTFHATIYDAPSYLSGIEKMQRTLRIRPDPEDHAGWWEKFRSQRRQTATQRARDRFVNAFARDIERTFAQATFEDDDHVVFTAVTELELMAGASFLARNPRTLQVNWHWLFHFPMFGAADAATVMRLTRLRELRRCFKQVRQALPYHRIHFFATTEALSRQYNQLGVVPFQEFSYPISERFAPNQHVAEESNEQRPIRYTCPGAVRREKGQRSFIFELARNIWHRDLAPGRANLILQTSRRELPRVKQSFAEAVPDVKPESIVSDQLDVNAITGGSGPSNLPIMILPHPLPVDQYSRLLESTDCGLLMYDSQDYFVRRAGVLGELLAMGRPVIVSAPNWLSEQLKEPHFQYAAKIARGPLVTRQLFLDDCSWSPQNVPLAGGVISFDNGSHPFELLFELNGAEDAAVLAFQWHCPTSIESYCRIDTALETSKSGFCHVIGVPENSDMAHVFLRFGAGEQRLIRLRFSNASNDASCSLKNVCLNVLSQPAAHLPAAVIGLAVPDSTLLPLAIDEMNTHYSHYRRTAAQFAGRWFNAHRPSATIGRFLSVAEKIQKAA